MDDNDGNDVPKNKSAKNSIGRLVAALPEVYQPIFGHSEFSAQASRACEDRLASVAQIYKTLAAKLGRPLRVLDLGCAQGFFSLSLAELGATVFGVDFQEPNIAVCKALAAEHSEFKASFQTGLVEKVIAGLEQDQYDLVLGLSVFHHLVHSKGVASVQKMIAVLAAKTAAGVFEMALSSEPPAWAPSQPQNPKCLLESYAFVHELAQNGTHLSPITRPLYVASNTYWFLNDRAEAFENWTDQSHAFANNASLGTRRTFFGNGVLAKIYALDNADKREPNAREHENEVRFLSNPPANFKTPKLLLHGEHERESWLAREMFPGDLLLDRIRSKKSYDASAVIGGVLEQLAALEATGLYHDDLRTWNILIEPDGRATLIDYGAISENTNDCVWPHNIFLSFMIFMREVVSARAFAPDPIRPPSFNPEGFPEPYRSTLEKLYELPAEKWRFSLLRDLFSQAQRKELSPSAQTRPSLSLALRATEDACRIYQDRGNYWRQRTAQTDASAQKTQNPPHQFDAAGKADRT